jgi:imidazolonepropionase-like amidohydrolase
MSKFLFLFCFLFFTIALWCDVKAVRSRWMIDVERGETIANPVVIVENEKIVQSGNAESIKIPATAQIIDVGELYLLPGLIDAHVHLAWGQPGQTGLAGAEDAKKTLFAGFTTVRNPGSTGMADVLLRDAINMGKVPGPRMLVSGPGLGSKNGICDQVFAGEAVVGSPQDAIRVVDDLAKKKVDLIKFCAGGKVIPSTDDISNRELEDSIVQSIVSEAHRLHLKVAAHAQGPDAILQAVSAGVDSIEHAGMINQKAAELMKQKKTYLVPTLYRLDWTLENAQDSGAKPEVIDKLKKGRADALSNIQMAIALGVPIAYGTDATVYPHGLNAREFAVLTQLGFYAASGNSGRNNQCR